jgi:xenotropic and polytropic retrovirus receptor 1
MLGEVETLYAARFGKYRDFTCHTSLAHCFTEKGDRKKAKNRLRASLKPQSHHLTTFRTGVFVGLSIPALISGIYEGEIPASFRGCTQHNNSSACQPDVQERVPGWSSLLQIYLAFFIPVVFGLLVSLNVIVWAYVRINYIFIFGELPSRIPHHAHSF